MQLNHFHTSVFAFPSDRSNAECDTGFALQLFCLDLCSCCDYLHTNGGPLFSGLHWCHPAGFSFFQFGELLCSLFQDVEYAHKKSRHICSVFVGSGCVSPTRWPAQNLWASLRLLSKRCFKNRGSALWIKRTSGSGCVSVILDLPFIFPHLISLLFFKVTNGYGGFAGCITGLGFRILLGESSVGLPIYLCLPGCTLVDGVYTQRAPVRTVSMIFSFIITLVISWLAEFMFNHRLLPRRWDIFKVKQEVTL